MEQSKVNEVDRAILVDVGSANNHALISSGIALNEQDRTESYHIVVSDNTVAVDVTKLEDLTCKVNSISIDKDSGSSNLLLTLVTPRSVRVKVLSAASS